MAQHKDNEVPEELKEKLSASADMSDWIYDFQNSTDGRFKGKSLDDRRKMAIAAYLKAHKKLDEISDETKNENLSDGWIKMSVKDFLHQENDPSNGDLTVADDAEFILFNGKKYLWIEKTPDGYEFLWYNTPHAFDTSEKAIKEIEKLHMKDEGDTDDLKENAQYIAIDTSMWTAVHGTTFDADNFWIFNTAKEPVKYSEKEAGRDYFVYSGKYSDAEFRAADWALRKGITTLYLVNNSIVESVAVGIVQRVLGKSGKHIIENHFSTLIKAENQHASVIMKLNGGNQGD